MSESVKLGKVSMTLGGDYSSSQAYDKLTCVQYDGRSWVSRKQVPAGVAPTEANSAYWQKISDRGVQGPQGQSYVDKELVPIVNDLTTGGSSNILSAEQGKVLDDKVAKLSSEVNIVDSRASLYLKGNEGTFYNGQGVLAKSSTFQSLGLIPLSAIDGINNGIEVLVGRLYSEGANVPSAVFFDSDKNFVGSYIGIVAAGETIPSSSIPSNAQYVGLNWLLADYVSIKGFSSLQEFAAKLSEDRNIVYFYEYGYISYDKTIQRSGSDQHRKFIMLPVNEGEQYAYYSKYSENLFIALCEDKNSWFSRQQVVEGWQNITIPSGCNFLAVSIQFNAAQEDAVAHAFLYNTKVTEQVSKTISDLSDKVDKELENLSTELENFTSSIDEMLGVTYQEEVIIPSDNAVCTMVVGESPSVNERSGYKCFRIPTQKGDKVSVLAKSGDSFPSYGLVKNNIFTFVSAKGLMVEQTFECDGSYDEIIVNNYIGYLGTPKVAKYEKIMATNSREVNILMLGNSFTQDSMSYVPFIMQSIAPNIKLNLAIGYIGGCPLAQHCANLIGENQVLNGITYSPTNYTYQLYESGNAAWKSVGSKSIDEMLAEKEWHIITLQQNGSDAAKSWDVCYAPFIYKIHKALYEKVSRTTKLGWLLVHGAYASTAESLLANWEGSAENTQKLQDFTANQIVFPYGTAVQNLRTTSLANLGDGGFLMGDTAHLHEGIACLAAAYANTLTILDCLGLGELSIIGEKTRPTKAWCTEHGVLSPNYGATTNDVVGITEDNCYLAQVAAIQAVKKPYEISDLANFVE